MALKEGEIIKVGYDLSNADGQLLNTTSDEKAKKEGIFNEQRKYKPVVVIVGEKHFFARIDEEIKKSDKGGKISVELEAKDAFGERNPEFIRMIPTREFTKQKLTPFPGMPVEVNDMWGRVQTVSGGRIRVDFNHPLAGKKIKYDLKIVDIVTGTENKISAMLEKFFPFIEDGKIAHSFKTGALEVALPDQPGIAPFKKAFSESTMKHIPEVKKVRFVEEFTKEGKKEKPAKAEKKAEEKETEKSEEKPTEKKETPAKKK